MSILDELMKAALAELRVTSEEVEAFWERALVELGDDDLQYIRSRQLDTELRSSTPEHHQRMRAEHQLTRLEKKALPALKKVLPIMFAIEDQKRRIEKIKSTERRQTEEHNKKQRDTPDLEFVTLIGRLIEFGATKHKVRQLASAELVIFADLTRWKAEDPKFRDEKNPWREVYSVYANRTIEYVEPSTRSKTRSVPGPPPAPSNDPRPRYETPYWRFDKIVEALKIENTDKPDDPKKSSLYTSNSNEQAIASDQTCGRSESRTVGRISLERLACISPDELKSLAERLAEVEGVQFLDFWPKSVPSLTYDSAILTNALEAEIAREGQNTLGFELFLSAVKSGMADDFISEERDRLVEIVANDIQYMRGATLRRLEAAGLISMPY